MTELVSSHTQDVAANQTAKKRKVRLFPIGIALFAMFFGAGNLVYPLSIGVAAGQYLPYAVIGFVLMGVGVPFLGLYATSLFQGDYKAFFAGLGKTPAFLTILFLILIIGPFSAMPRTEVITFQTIQPFLPAFLASPLFISALYCALVFFLTYKEARIVNILGYFLSPVKLISFSALIVLGLIVTHDPVTVSTGAVATLQNAMIDGYSTMDLLATFFFCSIAYIAVAREARQLGEVNEKALSKMTLKACLIGAVALAAVYLGFMLIASAHASQLQGLSPDQLIGAISYLVLGKFGAFFVAICITFACLSTAMALAEVSSQYLYEQIFRKRISKTVSLSFVVITMFFMSLLGFSGIMAIAVPILVVLYPALITLCVVNILYKTVGFSYVKTPVFLTVLLALAYYYL